HKMCFPRVENNAEHVDWWVFGREFESRTYCLVSQETLIAALSFLPIEVKFGDSIKRGAIVSNVMTHPGFRGQGLFMKLSRFSMKDENELYGTALGIARTHAVPVYLKSGWKNPLQLVYHSKRPSCHSPFHNGLKVVEKFDHSFDELIDQFNKGVGFGV